MKAKKHTIEPYLWLAPTIILFAVFTFYPFLKTAYMSLFIVNSMGETKRFVGLGNYLYIFQDDKFVKSIINTFVYVLISVPASKVIGLLLALLANRKRKTSSIYEVLFSLPMAMSMSVSAIIFQLLYNPSFGAINYIFHLNINWLNDERYAMLAIGIISIWMSSGYAFLFMLAAVRNVPEDILESTDLEGASWWQKVRYIYLPLTSPTMFFLICTSLASSMMMTALVNVLTDGGPFHSTQTIIHYMYSQFAVAGNYTNAFPAAIVAFILAAAVTWLSFLYEKKGVHYQ
ncbi:ABC transporter permease subunit [Clostridium sp. MCC353]|uniref:carbohydrate ABC transporter permease n=1 Tax=Clostridium sp. MCC353 TaxID=2592646 RepID=UPI001C02C4F6|nr:sugar ABC transporter permease [Clostridium sp. MCC353]MBT9774958.1 ABC transporter permease subunit [Clostridium sp. MCC353]